MSDTFEKVKDILVDVLGVEDDEVTEDSNLIDDLAAESIDFVDIAYNIEQEYGQKVNPGNIFPAFLQEGSVYDDSGKLLPEVKEKFKTDFAYISDEDIAAFEKSRDPNIFFSVKNIVGFIEKTLQ